MADKDNGPPKFGIGGKVTAVPSTKKEHTSESKELVTETFEEPEISDLAFNHKWTVWEQIESKGMKDYADTMEKVAWFGDAITFWKVWNKIPHSDPINFFSFNKEGKLFSNYYEIKGREEKVSTLAMFKTGIIPAWEDEANKEGGEYAAKVETDKEKTHKLWNGLVLDLVSDNFPASEKVCGIRVLDKGKLLKIELWVDYGLRKN
eukprot:CAMPEP_0205822844 /NCGR_PEP_ID=MMETSP0206-20130828/14280_1 /ASSEMBLY_ACC=CAM_ASM_000279 /TAXON_ID=36767 /ORGANISM="Euplotes focardii, Strain TN1" /LENGTH=204 /DNA_ID=CAMNT_0053119465 /DNA_START=10 /DNA_END=624 /DNA_ORIENTATION=+